MSIVEHRRNLHQIPELAFQEFETQRYLLTHITEAAVRTYPEYWVSYETWQTGILVHIKGTAPTQTIGWRADMDGLPIEERTDIPYASIHEGKMHACGHDFHMAIALSMVEHYSMNRPKDNLTIFFQPAEEDISGANAFQQSSLYQEWKPDKWFALHVAPERKVGEVCTKPGPLFASSWDVDLIFTGEGAHAASLHRGADAALAASSFLVQAQSILSRYIDPLMTGVLSFGTIQAGTARNVVAQVAKLTGTTNNASSFLLRRIQEVASSVAQGHQCSVDVSPHSSYPPVINWPKETEALWAFSSAYAEVKEAEFAMTSDDFGCLLQDTPGCMFWLGVDSEHGLHTDKFHPKEQALNVGLHYTIELLNHLMTTK